MRNYPFIFFILISLIFISCSKNSTKINPFVFESCGEITIQKESDLISCQKYVTLTLENPYTDTIDVFIQSFGFEEGVSELISNDDEQQWEFVNPIPNGPHPVDIRIDPGTTVTLKNWKAIDFCSNHIVNIFLFTHNRTNNQCHDWGGNSYDDCTETTEYGVFRQMQVCTTRTITLPQ